MIELTEKDIHLADFVTSCAINNYSLSHCETAKHYIKDLLHTSPFNELIYDKMTFSEIELLHLVEVGLDDDLIVMEDGLMESLAQQIQSVASELEKWKDDSDEDDEEGGNPNITIGCTWLKLGNVYILNGVGIQTGDNSYTGAAYMHEHWGVGYVESKHKDFSDASMLLCELLNDSLEQFAS